MQYFNSKTFILLFPVLLASLCYIIRKTTTIIKNKRAEELFSNYHKDRIIYFSKKVNFFGQKSATKSQIRGNGSLLLTPDKIHFLKWLPKQNLIIPLKDIENIEIVNSFLGKTKKQNLLKIDFKNKEQEIDSAAWLLDNMKIWKKVIETNIKNQA
ncbi:hypothetical protein [Halanaerobium praevalens]|uniref:GRAM domain-containing protein n=1 Tax=Halanaerobium praevalens (strain ATCC 33744 / DSM 2228 / GSL) TaxID=572479 RepID=E3DMW9_HALPG|nr:hypothetical protein [Halanaerobium praevalens]ADO77458.1 hypothetical protein Hprae_1325 [Halanaerobium praevalens DSM 2228]